MNRFQKLCDKIKERHPKFEYKFKDESRFMQFITRLMFFNKSFQRFTTTIGNTVYFPNREYLKDETNSFITLSHEYVHINDYSKSPVKFILSYLFPQILALPAVLFLLLSPVLIPLMCLSILPSYLIYSLLFMFFLLPFPSPGRYKTEVRGYGMSLMVIKYLNIHPWPILHNYADVFIDESYYFMWPFYFSVLRKLSSYILTDNLDEQVYRDVYELVK